MRLRHIPEAVPTIINHPYVLTEQILSGEDFHDVFPTDQPLFLEIGMGRGRFALRAAQLFPDHNLLAVEIRAEMIFQALEKEENIPDNLRFLWCDALLLADLLPGKQVRRIYLNFSDPWPKNRHAKRRLTAPAFLDIYRRILSNDGEIYFKTDNYPFFCWSLTSFAENGWVMREKNEDLPPDESGLYTEYEARYRRRGQPIFFAKFHQG